MGRVTLKPASLSAVLRARMLETAHPSSFDCRIFVVPSDKAERDSRTARYRRALDTIVSSGKLRIPLVGGSARKGEICTFYAISYLPSAGSTS